MDAVWSSAQHGEKGGREGGEEEEEKKEDGGKEIDGLDLRAGRLLAPLSQSNFD